MICVSISIVMNTKDEDIRQCKIMLQMNYEAYQEAISYHGSGRMSKENLDKFKTNLRDAELDLSNVMYKCEICSESDVDLMYDKHNERWLCFRCNGICQVKRDNELRKYQDQMDSERRANNIPPEYVKCSKCGDWSDDVQFDEENDIICSDCMFNAVTNDDVMDDDTLST